MRATIYKSTGAWYIAKSEEGVLYQCRMKGKLKIDREITSTNPIAVGDIVQMEEEDKTDHSAMITAIEKRRNYIIRVSPHNKHQMHIVAANLDQSIIIVTIKEPRTSTGFLDRYLVSCEAYHIPAIIVVNKSDLLDKEDMDYYQYLHAMYTKVGYPVYLMSAEKEEGLQELKQILSGKTSLLTGHSGVGKSTIMNRLIPNQHIATQEVSEWSGKGLHTTTFAEMYDLPESGRIIDTPGIRELGVMNIKRMELSGYYPEMKKLLNQCKYNNCSHFNEPQCAIKEAVQQGMIAEERYVNYAKIYESIDDKHY